MKQRSAKRTGLLGCFFLSGCSGLIYQVVWMRYLGQVFGNSVYATATVLAAFMAGLALGSFWGGRIADRRQDPVRLYGFFEIGVGVYCLLLPALLGLATPLYAFFYQRFGGTSPLLIFTRAIVCGGVLLLPTTFMGATLPLLIKHFVSSARLVGLTVSRVYAVNTFGAVAGSLLTGYLFIPQMGLSRTVLLGVAINVAVGIVSIFFLSKSPPREEEPADTCGRPAEQVGREHGAFAAREAHAVLLAFGLSGFAAMMDEVALVRVISLLIGSSTYAFSLMLTTFIFGIGLGSLALGNWVRPGRRLLLSIAAAQLGIALSTLAMVVLIGELPRWLVGVIYQYQSSFAQLQLVEFVSLFLIMVLPTCLMGVMFPLTVAVWTRSMKNVGTSSGEVYFTNTAGAIGGSLFAGFLSLPLLGAQGTLLLAIVINTAAVAAIFLAWQGHTFARRIATAAAPIAAGLLAFTYCPRWDLDQLTSGAFLYSVKAMKPGESPEEAIARQVKSQGRILYNADGTACTVTVKTNGPGAFHLSINGKVDASSVADMGTQKLVGHLPMFLHPGPEKALVVGLGSGMTFGAVLAHSPELAECVEISPEVIEAADLFFKDFNGDCLHNPRGHMIAGDGRNHLQLTGQTYDVIVSEPSNPWIAGIGNLFTLEYWQQCRAHLGEQGILCQWLQTYQILPSTLRLILRTFQQVFPDMTLWYAGRTDLILIGSKEPLEIGLKEINQRFQKSAVAADMKHIGIWDAQSLLSHYLAGAKNIRGLAGPGILHTDDNLRLEFDMPKQLYLSELNLLNLFFGLEKFRSPVAEILAENGRVEVMNQLQQSEWELNFSFLLLKMRLYEKALRRIRAARELNPAGVEPLMSLVEFLLAQAERLRKQKDWPSEWKTLQEVLQLRKELENVEQMHQEQVAIRIRSVSAASLPELFGQVAFFSGRNCENRGLAREAKRYYHQVLSWNSSHPGARNRLKQMQSANDSLN